MRVEDFDGTCEIFGEDELLARLRSVRRGEDGAFVLSHGGEESLWVHINGDTAFLCFFPRDGHPGFVPVGMWATRRSDVRFLQVDGGEGSAIWISWDQLLPVEAAYQAAVDFLHSPSPPESASWSEL
jgi:hypothetical protein